MVYKIKVFGFIILCLDHEKAGQGGFLKRPEGETFCEIVCVATFFCRKFCFLSPTHEVAETKPPTRNGKGRKLFSFLGIPRGNWKMFASGLRRGNLSLHTCAAPRPPAPSSSGATAAWPAGRAPVASGGGGGRGSAPRDSPRDLGCVRARGAPRNQLRAPGAWGTPAPHAGLGSGAGA